MVAVVTQPRPSITPSHFETTIFIYLNNYDVNLPLRTIGCPGTGHSHSCILCFINTIPNISSIFFHCSYWQPCIWRSAMVLVPLIDVIVLTYMLKYRSPIVRSSPEIPMANRKSSVLVVYSTGSSASVFMTCMFISYIFTVDTMFAIKNAKRKHKTIMLMHPLVRVLKLSSRL